MRCLALVLACLPFVACGPSPVAPTLAPAPAAELLPMRVWVSASGADEAALAIALHRLEEAAGGLVTIQRGTGPRQVRIVVDDAEVARHDAGRGMVGGAIPGRCVGQVEIVVAAGSRADVNVFLHELGHSFVDAEHSPDPADQMYYVGRPVDPRFSAREAAAMQARIRADVVTCAL